MLRVGVSQSSRWESPPDRWARREKPRGLRPLTKPRCWAPPASVFGPVWSLLYLTIGVAGWKLFRSASGRTKALHLVATLAERGRGRPSSSVCGTNARLWSMGSMDSGALGSRNRLTTGEDPVGGIAPVALPRVEHVRHGAERLGQRSRRGDGLTFGDRAHVALSCGL